jgi:hypothetical protein
MSGELEFTIQAINATTKKFLKNYVDLTVRQRFILSYLQKTGRIMTGESGTSLEWKVKARKPDVKTNGGSRREFSMKDVYVTLNTGYGHMTSTNMLDSLTLQINKGEQQIIKLVDEMGKDCSQAIGESLAAGFFVDGSSDPNQVTGLQEFINPDVGANTDRVAVPAAGTTYGGKSLVLGALGGKWSKSLGTGNYYNTKLASGLQNDWPEGSGDPQYDYLTPKMFNYTGAWSQGTNSWEVNCEKVLRRGHTSINVLGGEGMHPVVHVMSSGMYNTFQDSVQDRERLSLSDYATKLGFPDTMQYSGALLAIDFDCPAGQAFSFNPQEMALCSVNDQLFYTDGPTWSITEGGYLYLIGFLGNYRWNPKYIASYGSYTV